MTIKITELLTSKNYEMEEKLRAFLEGLEVTNIDLLMSDGKVGDFRRLGERMSELIKELKQNQSDHAQLAAEDKKELLEALKMVINICDMHQFPKVIYELIEKHEII